MSFYRINTLDSFAIGSSTRNMEKRDSFLDICEDSGKEYLRMVGDLAKPGEEILKTLTAEDAHRIHMCVGIVTEVAELQRAAVAVMDWWDGDPQYQTPDFFYFLLKNIKEEFGDIEFYLTGLLASYNLPTTLKMLKNCFPESEIVPSIKKTPETPDEILTSENSYLFDLAPVAGDIMDHICKRQIIYRKEFAHGEFEKRLVALAITFIESLIIFYSELGQQDSIFWDYSETLSENVDKLLKGKKARYASGTYSDKQASERADKQE